MLVVSAVEVVPAMSVSEAAGPGVLLVHLMMPSLPFTLSYVTDYTLLTLRNCHWIGHRYGSCDSDGICQKNIGS